jgi:hypothetical protein
MNIYSSTRLSCIFNEMQGIIKHAFNILAHMILKMVFLVGYITIEIACTIICRTIHYMSDSILLKDLFIGGHNITTQVKESIDDL